MVELWVKCEHGSLARHGQVPEGTKSGTYVAANKMVWCPGGRLATGDDIEAWCVAVARAEYEADIG